VNSLAQTPPPPPPPLIPNPQIIIDGITPNPYGEFNQVQSKPIQSISKGGLKLGTTLGLGFETGGIGVNAGLEANYSNFTASLEVADMLVSFSQPSGFYRDTFSNGQSRCRNSSSGRFASNGSCTDIDFSFRFLRNIDFTYTFLTTGIFGGMGIDLNDFNNLYPVVGFRSGENLSVKGKFGNNGTDIRVNFTREF
jgi:hypothetical protein